MNYIQAEEYIHSLLKFGIKPGLSRIKKLLSLCGNPQGELRFVHVAGTNGKGTTSTFTANILTEAGYKTGLFTSPYVSNFLERIQIDGKTVSEESFAEAVTEVKSAVEQTDDQPTEFEVITAAALICYKNEKCDIVVLEVGLGGRFDATNIIDTPLVGVIASISLDHTKILGDTIEKIAAEKCGIIKENGVTVTSSNQKPEAMKVIENICKEKHNRLIVSSPQKAKILNESLYGTVFEFENEEYSIKLTGLHQVENALNAIMAARQIENVTTESIKKGLAKTVLPARMQIIGENPLILLDGGHNEGCASALKSVAEKFIHTKITAVIGMMADKDCEKYLSVILPLCEKVITVTPNNPRAISAEKLVLIAKKYCGNVQTASSPAEALKKAKKITAANETILICGSFYLAGEYV